MAAYVVGAAINFAGCKFIISSNIQHLALHTQRELILSVLDNMGVKGFSTSLKRSFFFAWITSLLGAALTYYLLARLFPQKSFVVNKSQKWGEWTQDKVEAWSSARRLGDRETAEMVEQDEEKMGVGASELILDHEDAKEVEAVEDGPKRDKAGVAVLEA